MRGGFRTPRGGAGGGLGGMDPKAMAAAMKQLGIKTEDIPDVEEVVIRTKTKDIVVRPADVNVMIAQGQRTWQVTGDATERPRQATPAAAPANAATAAPAEAFSDEDVKLVMEQANVPRAKAVEALKAAGGEPAAAIVALLDES